MSGNVEFVTGNVFELGFDQCFDALLMCEVIERVAHPDRFMEVAAGYLKPRRVAVMTTPNGRCFKNDLPRFSDCSDPSVFESVQFKPNSDGHIFLLWPDEVRMFAARSRLELEKQIFFTTP